MTTPSPERDESEDRSLIEAMARTLCFQADHFGNPCSKCNSPADCRDWNAHAFSFREDAKALALVMLERLRDHNGKLRGTKRGQLVVTCFKPFRADELEIFARANGLERDET